MKKFLSGLLCAAMTASLFTVMSGGASADSTAVDSSWQYKTMVDFEDLQVGYQFGGTSDPCSLYVERGEGWQAKVNTGGYKGSNCFYLYSKGDKTGTYAQPLINASGFTNKNTEFVGATEFWMWVDFTHVTFDEVGLQFRIIEDDYKPDGTKAGADLSQISVGKGKPIYIQSGNSWKAISQSSKNYLLPVDSMKGYKGFVRIPLSSLVMNKAGTDDDNGKFDLLNVTQLWFIFNWPNTNPATDYVSFDQFMFVGPLKDGGKSISKIQLTDGSSTTATTKGGSTGGNTTAAPGAATTIAGTTDTTLADSSDIDSTDETDITTFAATTTTKTTATIAANTEQTKKSSPVVPIVIAVVCVVLVGGGAALYFFVLKKKFPNGLFKK